MNIEIIGRHALLFDDDTNAAFINSDDALVEWNSLLIDRYDVRHLLSSPPPSRRRRNPQTSHSSAADAEIDYERYLDLPSPSEEHEEHAKPELVGGFNAVPFSYGTYEDFNDKKIAEAESEISGFQPPFPVPDSLVQNLPPTEKVHQIIARTALFVSKNGGQSEIVLRVKQGDNPTFGFLMPDHHLHPYFRFLVEHQNLLQSKDSEQADNEKTSTTDNTSGAGALSLLGSVYGNVEDDDRGVEPVSSSVDVDPTNSHAPGKTILTAVEDEPVSKEDAPVQKRSALLNPFKAERTSSLKKSESLGLVSVVPDKLRASSLPPIPKTEQMVLDPPYDMKRLVDKIVEFVMKNGRQFEAVLMEQDRGHGRFPFLLPSNIFYPYYLKILQQAQEPKLTVKSLHNEKDDFGGHISNKKRSISRENENKRVESDDIPFDSERKEKFKMVINKPKKEGSEASAKATQPQPEVQVDAAQAAAILQAATRGIKLPNLAILSGQPSNEAESSETQMTREQKIKAERLKRAKMFVAQLKSGAAPLKSESSRGLSVEPRETEADNRVVAKERERSTTPLLNNDTADKKVKSENEQLNEEKRSKRNYRARVETVEMVEDDDEREAKRSHRHRTRKHRTRNRSDEVESEEKDDEEPDDKHVKRRHRSHRSSHKHKHNDIDERDEERNHKSSRKKKHRSPNCYEEDDHVSDHEYSKKRHRSRHSSLEESDDGVDSDHKYSRKKHKHRSHKHRKSHSSKHKHKLDDSSEEGQKDHNKDDRGKKRLNSDREELEEGEIGSKLSGQSRGVQPIDGASKKHSLDVSSSHQGQRSPSQPIETTDVPDDLRAKIRAMLMSTM